MLCFNFHFFLNLKILTISYVKRNNIMPVIRKAVPKQNKKLIDSDSELKKITKKMIERKKEEIKKKHIEEDSDEETETDSDYESDSESSSESSSKSKKTSKKDPPKKSSDKSSKSTKPVKSTKKKSESDTPKKKPSKTSKKEDSESEEEQEELDDKTKKALKKIIHMWLGADDRIKAIAKETKKLKHDKKTHEEQILKFMERIDNDTFKTKEGDTLKRFISKSKGGIKSDHVKKVLMESLKNERQVESLVHKIFDNRPVTQRVYLKRTRPREKK